MVGNGKHSNILQNLDRPKTRIVFMLQVAYRNGIWNNRESDLKPSKHVQFYQFLRNSGAKKVKEKGDARCECGVRQQEEKYVALQMQMQEAIICAVGRCVAC